MKNLKKIFYFLGSLKFAVIVILSIAVISATGTIVESKYNAEVAQLWVYKTIYMKIVLIAFATSIAISTFTRWPWKRKHIPFLTAHLGLLTLVYGAWITQTFGIDGSISIPVGQKSQWVSSVEKELELYATYDGQNYTSLYRKEIEFLLHDPKKEPIVIPTEDGPLEIIDFMPFAKKETKIEATDEPLTGPAVRFQLKNAQVDFSDWILHRGKRPEVFSLGPATVILEREKDEVKDHSGSNVLVIHANGDKLTYTVFYKDSARKSKHGSLKIGDTVDTGWMGLKFHLIKYYPLAKENTIFHPREYPNQMTVSAIEVKYRGKTYWQELNSLLRFFTDKTAYILSWRNKQLDLGFPVFLKEFQMTKYAGTNRASGYASVVQVDAHGPGDIVISMNEPLKQNGFTLYQASFQQDATGTPTTSILSVNYDPGRMIKYLGSLLIVFGSILLFFFRKHYAKPKGKV